jgi:uncharacterized RmlC-like cupin family protein
MNNPNKLMVVRQQSPEPTGRGFVRLNQLGKDNMPIESISMIVGDFPVGVKVTPHYHPYDEIVYIISGVNHVYYGPDLSEKVEVYEGDLLYIPAYTIHSPENPGSVVSRYLVARGGPEEVVCAPETLAVQDIE